MRWRGRRCRPECSVTSPRPTAFTPRWPPGTSRTYAGCAATTGLSPTSATRCTTRPPLSRKPKPTTRPRSTTSRMPEYPQLVYLSVPELIGAAGGDPWHVDETIQAGSPGEISELATSFRNAGVCMTETDEEFTAARKRFDAAWDRDDPAHP